MTTHIFQVSSLLLENAVEKMNNNFTSMILATSVFTLTLGYFSKLVYKQMKSPDKDAVSRPL